MILVFFSYNKSKIDCFFGNIDSRWIIFRPLMGTLNTVTLNNSQYLYIIFIYYPAPKERGVNHLTILGLCVRVRRSLALSVHNTFLSHFFNNYLSQILENTLIVYLCSMAELCFVPIRRQQKVNRFFKMLWLAT